MRHSSLKYRRASRHTLMWPIMFVLGNIIGIGAASILGRQIGAWAFALAVAIILGSLGLCSAIIGSKVKGRRAEIGRLLKSDQFHFAQSPTVDSFGGFNHLVSWGGWDQWLAEGQIKWLARTETMFVMERGWTTGDNVSENYEEHVETVGVVIHPNCQKLRGQRLVQERRTWHAFTADNAPAPLTPALQQALAGSPNGEWWYFWDGWARCCFPDAMDAKNVKVFLSHMGEVVKAI